MAGYDVPAAVEESAKAVQSLAEVATTFGGFVARVAGTAPENFFGIIDDKLKFIRGKRAVAYYVAARKILEDAGLDPECLAPPSPSIELPLLAAATLEDRDELVDLWTNLLVAATDPARRNRVRARHIEIAKSLEPLDAIMLTSMQKSIEEAVKAKKPTDIYPPFVEYLANEHHTDIDEINAALSNLADLRLINRGNDLRSLLLSSEGKNFLSVVGRERKD